MPHDDLPLRRIDHVRFFVGNARQSAYFYRNAFGFEVAAYAGLETRVKHESGYVLKQGKITFVLVSPLSSQHPESQRLVKHGDGVMDIAIEVADVQETYRKTTERGGIGVSPPALL
jgi:4-hydroxyphenylpyruvate dioxygenase